MLGVSSSVKSAIAGNGRTFKARITAGGSVLENVIRKIIFTYGSCGAEAYSFGSVFTSYADISLSSLDIALADQEMFIEIGVVLQSGEVEYIPMGYFTAGISDIQKARSLVTIKGSDRLAKVGTYIASVEFPTTIQSVLDDLSSQMGVQIKTSLDTTGTIERAIESGTYSSVLSVLSGLLGGFCYCDRKGNIVIAAHPTKTVTTVKEERCSSVQTSEDKYTIETLTVVASTGGTDPLGDEVEEVSFSEGSGTGISVENAYMTQGIFDSMKDRVVGYSFDSCTARFMGDPTIEQCDAIELVNYEGRSFFVPCMSLIHEFDGGFTTEIATPAKTSSDSSAKGPLQQAVENLKIALLTVEKLVAKKIVAERIDVDDLFAKAITATDMTITGKSRFVSEGTMKSEEDDEIEYGINAIVEAGKVTLEDGEGRRNVHTGTSSIFGWIDGGLWSKVNSRGLYIYNDELIACYTADELYGNANMKLIWLGDAALKKLTVDGRTVYGDKNVAFQTSPYKEATGRDVTINSSMSRCQKSTGHVSLVEQYKVVISSSGVVGAGALLNLGTVPDKYIPSTRVAVSAYVNNTTARVFTGSISTDGVIEVRPTIEMAAGTYYIAVSADYLLLTENVQDMSFSILEQPKTKEVNVGASATFTIDTDVSLTDEIDTRFIWQTSTNGSTWHNAQITTPGTTGSTYTIKSVTAEQDGLLVRCVVEHGEETITSNTVELLIWRERYSVTYNLENCTSDNMETVVKEGKPYYASITPDDGYVPSTKNVTMGGIDVTSKYASSYAVDIDKVTGNIVITYKAVKDSSSGDSGGGEDSGGGTGGDDTGGETQTLRITKQPQSVEVPKNTAVTFSIEAEGMNLSFQWKVGTTASMLNDQNATTTDANSSTLTIPANAYVNINKYICCVVTDGDGNTVTSETVRLVYVS